MKIFTNDSKLDTTSLKNISVDSTTLKVDCVSLPIEVALKDFSDYDRVAIILNCSSVDLTYYSESVSSPIYSAAANLGRKLQNIFGQKDVSLYAKNTDLARNVCTSIDKYWNNHQSFSIKTSSMIDGNTFGVSGSWDNIIAQSKTTNMKSQVGYWQKSFASSLPSGLSLWVTDDIVLVPIIYNTEMFDPEAAKTALNISTYPWISPLTGVIVGVKNNSVNARIISGLEVGFISTGGQDNPFVHMTALVNNDLARRNKRVATTYRYPNVTGNLKADLDYTFDKGNTNNHPLYCVSPFDGCGACLKCQKCVSGCQACVNCDSCDSCQNCNSCQTVCQTSGYSKQDALVRVPNSCNSTNCNGCNTCVGGYQLTYKVDYYPCKACVANTGADPSGCSGTGCAPCWGCNSETALMCVPTCETGCYKGCTADNATYYNRWHCDSTCMTCVGISQYACSDCYGANNYDKVI